MTEWTVVVVIIALVGLLVAVGTPVIRLNTSITRLNVILDQVQKDQGQNAKEHEKFRDELSNHNMRLHDLDGQ